MSSSAIVVVGNMMPVLHNHHDWRACLFAGRNFGRINLMKKGAAFSLCYSYSV